MTCPCDKLIHPPPLDIDAALERIPRQIADFAAFRRALLAQLDRHPPLQQWRARDEDDLGVMLLEMWAYVCDVLSFYDEVIAHEAYLRTARRRPSLRKLVALLGHEPCPAVAASVYLAAIAEGNRPVELPAGTAFRSGAFDGQPPQVFELEEDVTIHPRNNRWRLGPQRPATLEGTTEEGTGGLERVPVMPVIPRPQPIGPGPIPGVGPMVPRPKPVGPGLMPDVRPLNLPPQPTGPGIGDLSGRFASSMGGLTAADLQRQFPPGFITGLGGGTIERDYLLLKPDSVDLAEGDPILVHTDGSDGNAQVQTVVKVEPYQGRDGDSYTRVTFEEALTLPDSTKPEALRLSRPTQTAGLWQDTALGKALSLDALYRQIRPGSLILLSRAGEYRWFRVTEAAENKVTIMEEQTTKIKDNKDNKDKVIKTIVSPEVKAPVTRLTLHKAVNTDAAPGGNWTNPDEITVHYGLVNAGKVTAEAHTALSGDGSPTLTSPSGGAARPPSREHLPDRLLLQDRNDDGQLVEDHFGFRGDRLNLGPLDSFLETPVEVFGNVLRASRGETVPREVLGSGDASKAEQSFRLAKKPLTYLPAPSGDGGCEVTSTLTVWVDGIRWREVPGFFGTHPDERVYIVRQNDRGESTVTFRGRLPTGVDNVVAHYRFGAGAAEPPAGTVRQLARPVKGLTGVHNPLPASGGADAEGAKQLRHSAHRSALLLGRAVSLEDFEAKAALRPGVEAVRVTWRWHEKRQQPVVQIWYVGDPGIEKDIHKALKDSTDPTVGIAVQRARPRSLRLVLTLKVDPRHRPDQVRTRVRRTLTDPEEGVLAPQNIGIDRPLFRSRIFEQALGVEGVVAVTTLEHDRFSPRAPVPLPLIPPLTILPTDVLRFTPGPVVPATAGPVGLSGVPPAGTAGPPVPIPLPFPVTTTVPFTAVTIEPGDGYYFKLEEDGPVVNVREDDDG